MNGLRRLIREIHRRSIWQVLGIYAGASWAVLQGVDVLVEGFALPSWFPAFALGLLLIGLPIVLATAFVQEGPPGDDGEEPAGAGVGMRTAPSSSRILTWRNAILGGVGAFALWGVVAAGWLLLHGATRGGPPWAPSLGLSAGGPGPPPIRPGRTRQITFTPALELAPTISPDGRYVAYAVTDGTADTRLLVRQVDGTRTLPVTGGTGAPERFPSYSADGTRLVFESGGRILEVPSLGGSPRPVYARPEAANDRYPAWSRDRRLLAYVTDEAVMIYDPEADEHRQLVAEHNAHSLAWSPDGSLLAFVTGNESYHSLSFAFGNIAPSAIHTVPVAGGTPGTVVPNTSLNMSPTWLGDRRLLFVSTRGGGRDVYALTLDEGGAPLGQPERVTTGLEPHTISASADGGILAFSTLLRRQNVWSVAIPAAGTVSAYDGDLVTHGRQIIEGLRVSPDGSRIAFDANRYGQQDVFVRALEGGDVVRVTDHPADEFVRGWSPDGEWLAGHGFRNGNRDVFVVRVDGTGFRHVLETPEHERYPDWSPDGDRLLYRRDDRGSLTLFQATRGPDDAWSETGPLIAGRAGRWSPDGRRIAFRRNGLWVIAPNGSELRQIVRDPRLQDLEWTDSGDHLVYLVERPDGTAAYRVVPAGGGEPRELVTFDDPLRRPRPEFDVHGGRIYYTIGETEADIWVMELITG